MTASPRSVQVIDRPEAAATALRGTRRTLLAALAEPDSAAGLARRLGLPRQRLNYHLRALEKAGLLECVEERRKGNCTERILRATARSFVISPDALGSFGPTPESRTRSLQRLLCGRRRGTDHHRSLGPRRARARRRAAHLDADARLGDPVRVPRIAGGVCPGTDRTHRRARREIPRRRVTAWPAVSAGDDRASAPGRSIDAATVAPHHRHSRDTVAMSPNRRRQLRPTRRRR